MDSAIDMVKNIPQETVLLRPTPTYLWKAKNAEWNNTHYDLFKKKYNFKEGIFYPNLQF